MISKPGMNLKKPMRVKFLNEKGVDEGGVKKEFFQILTEKLFTLKYGMFLPKNVAFDYFSLSILE